MARNYRLEIIEALGGQCQWHEGCTVTDPDMLQVDHVNGGGNKERRQYSSVSANLPGKSYIASGVRSDHTYYRHLFLNIQTGDYQVLCANHNAKKAALERRAKKLAKAAA